MRNLFSLREVIIFALICLVVCIIFSCNPAQSNKPSDETFTESETVNVEKANEMLGQLPSPIEMAVLIKEAGAKFNGDLPNSVQQLNKYETTGKKALNLGIYSADVGYTTLFKQTQQTMFYLKCTQKLSNEIGLSGAFAPSVYDRVEDNIEHRDSLVAIISEAYQTANAYLKNNDRVNISVLMVGGAWVECMYLATKLSNEFPNKEIVSVIAGQQQTLHKLIKVMGAYSADKDINTLLKTMKELELLYHNKTEITKESKDVQMNEEQFNLLAAKIAAIRSELIS